jgi:hypothetical protein
LPLEWCNRFVTRTPILVVAALAAAFFLASPAVAAAPNYILVNGHGLGNPILLADWNENLLLLSALAGAPHTTRSIARALAHRPRFDLAEFWGWGERPPPTQPSQANQHGWFYPARRSLPAVFDLMVDGVRAPRIAPRSALTILARHGVPTRV